MKRSYECAYVRTVTSRGPMEKVCRRVLHQEIKILQRMWGDVRVIPTDDNVGGDTHHDVIPAAEFDRLRRAYGMDKERNTPWVEVVYGTDYDSPAFIAALEAAERYEIEFSTITPPDDAPAPSIEADEALSADEIAEAMTVAEIKDALVAADIAIPTGARKAALAELLATHRSEVPQAA